MLKLLLFVVLFFFFLVGSSFWRLLFLIATALGVAATFQTVLFLVSRLQLCRRATLWPLPPLSPTSSGALDSLAIDSIQEHLIFNSLYVLATPGVPPVQHKVYELPLESLDLEALQGVSEGVERHVASLLVVLQLDRLLQGVSEGREQGGQAVQAGALVEELIGA